MSELLFRRRSAGRLTLPPPPPDQEKATLLPGLAGTTRAAFCAFCPHERLGLDAPLTGSMLSIRRMGLSSGYYSSVNRFRVCGEARGVLGVWLGTLPA